MNPSPTRYLVRIPSRHALRDIAQNFVRRAVSQLGMLQRIDAQPFTGTEQNNFVSHCTPGMPVTSTSVRSIEIRPTIGA